MLDDKIKLEQYFEEEIKRVSDIEIAGIEQEIDEIEKIHGGPGAGSTT